ncbi:hypothetical protein [Comamonas denitrificans]|uniref:hypothetical protein n=1 Tax=Comamonas denitrificans TaxID=117506 RepID=UPI0036175931
MSYETYGHPIADPEKDIGYAITSSTNEHGVRRPATVAVGFSLADGAINLDMHFSIKGLERLAAKLLVAADEARTFEARKTKK